MPRSGSLLWSGIFCRKPSIAEAGRRKAMIDSGHPRLSIVRQCVLASISWSSLYREPTARNEETVRLMRLIDEQLLETPWYGSLPVARHLCRHGWGGGRGRGRGRPLVV